MKFFAHFANMALIRTLSVLWLFSSASAQFYGSTEIAVPEATCLDGGVEYTSHIGASSFGICAVDGLRLSGVTSDECGRTCAADPDCWCATHDRGECALLPKDCCMADVLTPCPSGVVQEESRGFEYVVGGLSGKTRTTRYWDCAKPACGWRGSNPVTSPVRSCRRDGLTTASPEEKSGVGGGSAYACTNQQPWTSRFDPKLAFAYVAFTPPGGQARACCACLEMTFVDPRLAGKRLVVQIINANGASDAATGGHVDIAVPGGGIGAENGCKSQWNAGASWGQLYGGLGPNRVECEGLPESLRPGCRWQYDWLLDVRSDVTYREIVCPGALIRASRCTRR